MAQTAVEYLFMMLANHNILNHKVLADNKHLTELTYRIKTDAKQMEKEQMKESWFNSTLQFDNAASMVDKKEFEQYYNETYGKE